MVVATWQYYAAIAVVLFFIWLWFGPQKVKGVFYGPGYVSLLSDHLDIPKNQSIQSTNQSISDEEISLVDLIYVLY